MPAQRVIAGQSMPQRQARVALRKYRGSEEEEQMKALQIALRRYAGMQANN